MIEHAYTFDDVNLTPTYSEVDSRSHVNLESELVSGLKFKIPIISANMNTVTEARMIKAMLENGGTGALHRYFTEETFEREINKLHDCSGYGITVGTDLNIVEAFLSIAKNPSYVIIDIAHGHSKHMKDTIKFIKTCYPDLPIIAGNICTSMAAWDLAEWGASVLKVGISAGGICSTRKIAGVGFPQWSAVKKVAETVRTINKNEGLNIKVI